MATEWSPFIESMLLKRGGSMHGGPSVLWSPAGSLAPFRASTGTDSTSQSPDASKNLGHGAFGTVTIARLTDDQGSVHIVARKSVPIWKAIAQSPTPNGKPQCDAERRFAMRYLAVAERLGDRGVPGLVRIMSATESRDSILVTMEYMDLGHIGLAAPLPCDRAAAVARQVLQGLRCLHNELRTLHRDIKPENILLNSKGEVKLADFGVAAVLDEGVSEATDQAGTILQMSPERLRGEPHGPPSDVWALGVTMAQIVLGFHPFLHRHHAEAVITQPVGSTDRFWQLAETIRHTDTRAACEAAIRSCLAKVLVHESHMFQDFVRCCTAEDAGARASVEDLLDHPFTASAPSAFLLSPPFTPAVLANNEQACACLEGSLLVAHDL